MGFFGAIASLTWSIIYCFIIFPIKFVLAFVGWLFSLLAYFPIIFILLAITLLMFPWTTYHDKIVENIEFGMRCRVAPIWNGIVRIFFQIFRLVWNPFICWWNALNWFAFGWIQDVIIPIALDGGIVDAIKKASDVLIKVVRDVAAGWILSGDFLTIGVDWTSRNINAGSCSPVPEPFGCDPNLPTGTFPGCDSIPCDWDSTAPDVFPGSMGAVVPGTDTEEQCIAKSNFFSNDCAALCDYWISFFRSWSNLIGTYCNDLRILWKLQGVLNPLLFIPYLSQLVPGLPLLNVLSLFGSAQLQDPQFWCFAENLVNAGASVLHIAWRLFAELVSSAPITRPDGTIFWDYTCAAVQCLVRSTENLAQIFVDEFLPWNIQFSARPNHPVCPVPDINNIPLNSPFRSDPTCCIDTTDREIANRCKIQRSGLLCAIDTLFCILAKSANALLNILLQIDRVANYPVDDYYETVIKAQWVDMLNLWAPLTRFAPIIVFHPDDISEPFPYPACPESACLDSVTVTPNMVPGEPFCLTYKFDKLDTFSNCDVEEFILDLPPCVNAADVYFQGTAANMNGCVPTVVATDYGAQSQAMCSPFTLDPMDHYPNIASPLRIKANDPLCCPGGPGTECEITVCMPGTFIDSPGGIGILNVQEPASAMKCNECKANYGFRCPPAADPILVLTDNHVSVDDPDSNIFGMLTVTDCLCVFITRLLCDPSNPTLPCFNEDTLFDFEEAMFDFCCLTDIVFRAVADLLMGFIELTFSFTSPDKFFVFLDKMPYLRIFKENVVALADCLFKAFQFIDTGQGDSKSVGFCLKNIFVQIVRFALCIAEYAIRIVLGLIFLPYYIIELDGYENFILEPNLARDTFVDIINQFVGEEKDSFVNCLCYLLNAGIPIPPLTIEGFCASCTLGGFVEPGPNTKRDVRRGDGSTVERNGGFAIPTMKSKWAGSAASKIGPTRMYKGESLNPATIVKNLKRNSLMSGIKAIPEELRDVNAYIKKRRGELLKSWEVERECREAIHETMDMKDTDPTNYARLEAMRRLPSQLKCGKTTKKRQKEIFEERIQTRPPVETVSSCIFPQPVGCDPMATWTGNNYTDTISNACNPAFENGPPCFDLCCIFRSVLRLAGHVLKLLARFLNSLTQEWNTDNFNPTFPYFLGNNCQYDFTGIPAGEPGVPLDGCFENDLRILIQLLIDPVVCVCRIIELLIPIIPGVPQPDLCCFLSNTADLIGCIMQIFINAIKALALDGEVESQCPQGTTPFPSSPIACNVNYGIDGDLTGIPCTRSSSDALLPEGCNPNYGNNGDLTDYPCTGGAPVECNPNVVDPEDPTFCTGCTPAFTPIIVNNVLQNPPDPSTCATVECDLGADGDGIAFSYFTTGQFLDEIDIALKITVSVVDCLCNLFNAVFPMKALSKGIFDPCCIAMSFARAAVEVLRFVLQVIINIATVQTSGFCYWRLDPERCGIGGTNENPGAHLGEIGFVKQLDALITTILTDRGGTCGRVKKWLPEGCNENVPLNSGPTACVDFVLVGTAVGNMIDEYLPQGCDVSLPIGGTDPDACATKMSRLVVPCAGADLGDQGDGGIIGCMCSLISAIIPIRPDPGEPVGPGNCPTLDFCCMFRSLSFVAKDLIMYMAQGLVSFWQPAKKGDPPTRPSYFVDFVFCDETTECDMDTTIPCNCGRFNIILEGFLDFLIGCPCQFFVILEAFLDEFLPIGDPTSEKFDCFCGEEGVLCAMRDLLEVLIKQILRLVRVGFSQQQATGKPPGVSQADVFWSPPDGVPYGAPGTSTNDNEADPFDSTVEQQGTIFFLDRTWAGTFFVPIADAICRLVSSPLCFINKFFDLPCGEGRTLIVRSIVRWALEIGIRSIAFIEGIVKVFVGEITGADSDIANGDLGTSTLGNGIPIKADPLGDVVSNLLFVFIDAVLADSSTLCGIRGGTFTVGGTMGTLDCLCYNQPSPADPLVLGIPDFANNQCTLLTVGIMVPLVVVTTQPPCVPLLANLIPPTVLQPDTMPPARCVPNRCVVNGFRIKCDLPDCGVCRDADPGTFCHDRPLDGILITLLRYMRCMLGPAGVIFEPLITILSIFWQVLGAIIRFFVALVVLLFRIAALTLGNCGCWEEGNTDSYKQIGGFCYKCRQEGMDPICAHPAGLLDNPGPPFAVCSLFDVFDAITGVFDAFVGIFTSLTKIVTPQFARDMFTREVSGESVKTPRHMEPIQKGRANQEQRLEQMPKRGRRIPRQEFRKRAHAMRGKMLYQPVNGLEVMAEAMFDYDVSDCFEDPVGCCCRNMHVEEMCTWDADHGTRHAKRDEPVTVEDVMKAANTHFGDGDDTVCGHTIKSCAGMTWDSIPDAERIEWVACMELRFQGERLHDLMPSIPVDMFYNKDGTYEWAHNLVHEAKRSVFVQAVSTGRWNFNTRKNAAKDTDVTKWRRFLGNLHKSRSPYSRHLRRRSGGIRDPMFVDAAVDLAIIETKIRSGYYTWLVSKGYDNWKTGRWNAGSVLDGIQMLKTETKNLFHQVIKAPYADIIHQSVDAWHATKDVLNDMKQRGLPKWWEESRKRTLTPKQVEVSKKKAARRKKIRDAYYGGPFYTWWNTTTVRTNGYKRLYVHLKNVVTRQRAAYKRSSFNLFNFDLKFTQLRGRLAKRFEPKWTPAKLANHEKVNNVALKIYSKFQPDHIRRQMEVERGFLINGDCRIIDETWALITFLFDYCVDEFVANIPDITVREGSFVESRLGKSEFMQSPNVLTSHDIKRSMHKRDVDQHLKDGKWIRPRVVLKKSTRIRFSSLPKRAWRRALVGGQPFDLFDWTLCLIEDLLDSSISSDVMDLIVDIEAWLTNQNVDYVNTGGDVGLLYWIRFWFRCEFPANLNCSIGIGFERAVGVVGLWSLIVFVGLSLIFPSTMLPLVSVGAFLFYVIVIPAVAWHYSPRCWLMTPTAAFGVTTLIPEGLSTITDFLIRLGEGVSVPIIPWPVAFPALPECFWDEIIDFFDTYLTDCYDFLDQKGLGFILPRCMVIGDICPPCEQMIDIVNCKEVGINDGLENIIYFINLQFPTAGQFVAEKIATVCLFNGCIADVFPFDFQYVLDLFDRFSDVSITQECRLNWCFGATLPTLAFAVFVGLLIFSILQFLIPLIFEFLGCLWAVFRDSPMSILWLGNASNWVGAPGDQTSADVASVDSRIGGGIGAYLETKESRRARVQQMMIEDDNRWVSGLASMIGNIFFKPAIDKLKRE